MPGIASALGGRGKSLMDILAGRIADVREGYDKLGNSRNPVGEYLQGALRVGSDPTLDLMPVGGMVRMLSPDDIVKTIVGQVGRVRKVNPKAYEAMVEFPGGMRPVGYADLDKVGVGALDMPIERLQQWYETMGKIR